MKRARAMAARAMMTAVRVVGEEEGKGGKATRVAGELMETWTKSVMATKIREAARKRGLAGAARAMAMVRKTAMASNDDDNHDNGNNRDKDDNHGDNGVKDGNNDDDTDNKDKEKDI
jgi:hypothetical protein